jgi:hypothetical protein
VQDQKPSDNSVPILPKKGVPLDPQEIWERILKEEQEKERKEGGRRFSDSGLGDGIATLAKTHGYTITSDEVYAHADLLGQDGDLTDFELEMISRGGRGFSSGC